jgi:ACR3 family arsenite transporter
VTTEKADSDNFTHEAIQEKDESTIKSDEVIDAPITQKEHKLGFFEKLLAVWVVLCMGMGILLSIYLPKFGETLNNWNLFETWRGGIGINIPIGICLFFMMYPAMLNLQFNEVKKLGRNPLPIVLTLISNWIIAPLVAAGLAYLILPGNPDLIIAVILLGSSPCTAMVLVWGSLAKGNQEQNVINTSINTVSIMFLYVPIVSLLAGIGSLSIDIIHHCKHLYWRAINSRTFK